MPIPAEPVTGYTLGDGWRHYRDDGITAKAEPYDAGHPAVIGWRGLGNGRVRSVR